MTDIAAPILVSVIALTVHDMTRRTVAEQGRLRKQIEDLIRSALGPVPAARRIVLDAPQGFVIALLDRRRAVLELAERVQSRAADLPLCIGINYGPVAIVEDANRGHALVGDGIAAAMTMALAAAPGRMIASRPFHEALQADAPGSAARLGTAGLHTDTQIRAHELFALDHRAARAWRKRLAITGFMACAGILALGVGARVALYGGWLRVVPAVIEFHVKPRGDVYVDSVLQGNSPPLKRLEVVPGRHTIEIRNSKYPSRTIKINPGAADEMTIAHTFRASPAVVEFHVTPRGDVYVDSVLMGNSPPLKRLEVSPGRHTIEIRNNKYPSRTIKINPGAAEKMTITHAFHLRPAVVEFHVTPSGGVYVDGVLRGNSPPLKRLEVAPGRHTIEIRNSKYPSRTVNINPGAAEKLTITHTFRSRRARTNNAKSRDKSFRKRAQDGWRRFRREAGF